MEAAVGSVEVGQVSEVGRSLVMEGFVSEEEDFELDPLWDREKVEVLEDRDNVVSMWVRRQAAESWMN